MKNYISFEAAIKTLSINTVTNLYDICFFYNIQLYAKHPVRKDIREVYEAKSPITKSINVNFGLNEIETNLVNSYEKILHDILDTNDTERRNKLSLQIQPYEDYLEKLNLYNSKDKNNPCLFDDVPHRFHSSEEGTTWKRRCILLEVNGKKYSLVRKEEILILNSDITKIDNLTKNEFVFDKQNFSIFANDIMYILGTSQFKIIKAIYDLTVKNSAFVGKSKITALADVYPTKGIPTIFSKMESDDYLFWKNFIEVKQTKFTKKNGKSDKITNSKYRVRCRKDKNYQIDR